MDEAEFFSVFECAHRSGTSVWTWRGYAYKGLIASCKPGGRGRLLIPRSEYHRIMTEGMRPARPAVEQRSA